MRGTESVIGVAALLFGFWTFQVFLIGFGTLITCFALMHQTDWNNGVLRMLRPLPTLLILLDLFINMVALAGIPFVFFGYGFHF